MTRKYQYLFNDDSGYHFMNTEDYEQTFLQKEMINAPQFLKEGDMVEIMFHAEEEKPLSCVFSSLKFKSTSKPAAVNWDFW